MHTFHDLYQRYANDLYRYGLALCGNRAMAEDLTSETFLRAMSSSTPIKTETVKAYLCAILRHLFFEQRQKAARHTSFDEQTHGELWSVEHDLAAQQQNAQLLRAIQSLPEQDRVVLLLRAYDDMPYEDIAQILSISVAAAKVRVHRARFRLDQLLEEKQS